MWLNFVLEPLSARSATRSSFRMYSDFALQFSTRLGTVVGPETAAGSGFTLCENLAGRERSTRLRSPAEGRQAVNQTRVLREVRVDRILPAHFQARQVFPAEVINQLPASMKEVGQNSP